MLNLSKKGTHNEKNVYKIAAKYNGNRIETFHLQFRLNAKNKDKRWAKIPRIIKHEEIYEWISFINGDGELILKINERKEIKWWLLSISFEGCCSSFWDFRRWPLLFVY